MLKILVRWPNGNISEFKIDKDAAVLGRAPESDVFLPSELASRQHARVFVKNDEVFIEDLESANGTSVCNEKIKVPTSITPEDPIKLGDVFIRVVLEGETPKYLATSTGSYSLAERLGDRKRTSVLDANSLDATLREALASGQDSAPGAGDTGKKK